MTGQSINEDDLPKREISILDLISDFLLDKGYVGDIDGLFINEDGKMVSVLVSDTRLQINAAAQTSDIFDLMDPSSFGKIELFLESVDVFSG